MSLFVIAVGRVKDNHLREACLGYAVRVRKHTKLEIIEVKDSGRPERLSDLAREEEGRLLLRAIPAGARVFALTRTGVGETSSRLAKRLGTFRDQGVDVAFLLGGAYGLADEVIERAYHRMSISQMTLPHELARVVLLEQLYRVCTIWRGEPYHKGD
jgi:23S rRNA (pseudouridine1915-N3)-methyltransferase